MTEKVLLKDLLFNEAKVERVAEDIRRAYPSFRKNAFFRDAVGKFPQLELKERITWMAERLKKHLPVDFRAAVQIILRSLPPPNDPELSDGDFGDFIFSPYAEFVARYGCREEHLAFSLDALYQLTKRFSAEDAIRYFINVFPEETLGTMLEWSRDAHYHVRRLCSEGARPKLPWSQKIAIPIPAAIPILDNLYSDPTRFVTRSVANHINDISKLDPDLAITTLSRWKKSGKQAPAEMDFILRHALRTLIKNGNPEALLLVGVSDTADLRISNFMLPEKVGMNTSLEFSFEITAREEANIIADYILYFQNKSGKLGSRKVFKLKRLTLARGEGVTLTKRHLLRERMSTRTLYRGRHEIEIQVNGRSYGRKAFWIE